MFEVQSSNAKAAIDVLASAAQAQVDDDQKQIADLKAQLAAVPPPVPIPVVYDHLEGGPWAANSKMEVGGSGHALGGWKAPGVECAELWITDDPAFSAPNYADCYFTQDFAIDGSKTKFKLECSWLFPTAVDIAASQCVEMEARQVTDDQKMCIVACQLNFAGNQLRYWAGPGKWTASGVAMPRPIPGTWTTVVLEGHRDSTTVFHDAITVNGTVNKLGTSYPMSPTTWRRMQRCALQLDDTGAVNSYRAKIDNVKYTLL